MSQKPTAEEISKDYDLTGKVALVTGGNCGIGKETVRVLALRNCRVILCSRSLEKGNQAKDDILKSIGRDKDGLIEVMQLNLSILDDVRDFGKRFEQRVNKDLHILILNAGLLNPSETPLLTEDGIEIHFAVNHLGHYLLTHLLLPYLKSSQPSRVVVVSSDAYTMVEGEVDVEDYNFVKKSISASSFSGYCHSKLYNIYFSNELNKKLHGTGVICNSLYPGIIKTELFRSLDIEVDIMLESISEGDNEPILSTEQGAATTIYVSASQDIVEGGKYYKYCQPTDTWEVAKNAIHSSKLFEVSQRLTGAVF